MGYAARRNPNTQPEAKRRRTAEATLRAVLAAFPDRATYEQWLTARQVPEAHRAHMESRLPAHLQAQGTV